MTDYRKAQKLTNCSGAKFVCMFATSRKRSMEFPSEALDTQGWPTIDHIKARNLYNWLI
jgi:hypothetical protein